MEGLPVKKQEKKTVKFSTVASTAFLVQYFSL